MTMADKIVHIPNPPYDPKKHSPPSILYSGLMRMGSMSLAHALATLGIRTHHLLEAGWEDYPILHRAAEATWPQSSGPSKTFSREEWDEIFGTYDCITDIAAYFLPQLLEAYPDSKIIIVQRDFDSWWKSYREGVAFQILGDTVGQLVFIKACEFVVGLPVGAAMAHILKGFFNVNDLAELDSCIHEKYLEHYAYVRRAVPRERILEYKMGDGWEPLCRFLNKEVPEVPFPRVNDAEEQRKRGFKNLGMALRQRARNVGPWIVGSVVLLAALLFVSRAGYSGITSLDF